MVDCMPSCMSQGIKGNIWDNTMSKGGNGAHMSNWQHHEHFIFVVKYCWLHMGYNHAKP
jgi:hypothetical protein